MNIREAKRGTKDLAVREKLNADQLRERVTIFQTAFNELVGDKTFEKLLEDRGITFDRIRESAISSFHDNLVSPEQARIALLTHIASAAIEELVAHNPTREIKGDERASEPLVAYVRHQLQTKPAVQK